MRIAPTPFIAAIFLASHAGAADTNKSHPLVVEFRAMSEDLKMSAYDRKRWRALVEIIDSNCEFNDQNLIDENGSVNIVNVPASQEELNCVGAILNLKSIYRKNKPNEGSP